MILFEYNSGLDNIMKSFSSFYKENLFNFQSSYDKFSENILAVMKQSDSSIMKCSQSLAKFSTNFKVEPLSAFNAHQPLLINPINISTDFYKSLNAYFEQYFSDYSNFLKAYPTLDFTKYKICNNLIQYDGEILDFKKAIDEIIQAENPNDAAEKSTMQYISKLKPAVVFLIFLLYFFPMYFNQKSMELKSLHAEHTIDTISTDISFLVKQVYSYMIMANNSCIFISDLSKHYPIIGLPFDLLKALLIGELTFLLHKKYKKPIRKLPKTEKKKFLKSQKQIISEAINNPVVEKIVEPNIRMVKFDNTKIYCNYSTKSAVIATLSFGRAFNIIYKNNHWCFIEFLTCEGKALRGWIQIQNTMRINNI